MVVVSDLILMQAISPKQIKLVNYLESMPDNKIPATYQDPAGSGRISIVSETPEEGDDTQAGPSDTPTDPSGTSTDSNVGGSGSDNNATKGHTEGLPQTSDDSLRIIAPLVIASVLSSFVLAVLALLFARKRNTTCKTHQRIL